jgi:hypothetical protein
MNKANTDILLFNLIDILHNNIPLAYEPYTEPLTKVSYWVNDFLAKSNPRLGRTGAVCPYVQYSNEHKFFKVGIFEHLEPKQHVVIDIIRNLKNVFVAMEPVSEKEKKFKAITILFPNLKNDEIPGIIDDIQLLLKPEFVQQGLMIGQFYENCQQGGLRNANFRPLQSPVPLIAIRYMVETDWPFLAGDPLLEKAYETNFGKINFGTKNHIN